MFTYGFGEYRYEIAITTESNTTTVRYFVQELTGNVLKLHSETATPADMEFVRYTGAIPQ